MSLNGKIATTEHLKGNMTPADGFSPIVEVNEVENGHEIVITDRKGKKAFTVKNGEKGELPIDLLERYYSPSIVTKATGETIAITDSANVSPLSLIPYGKSTQKAYEGNQLLDSSFRNTYGIIQCIGCSAKESNGMFTVTSSSADMQVWDIKNKGENYHVDTNGYLMTIPDGITKISVKLSNTEFNKNFVTYYDEHKVSLGYINSNSNEFAQTIKSGAKYFSLRFGKGDAVVGTVYETTVMVNVGSELKEWEPFVGCEASPSLAYPQEVTPLGASGSIEYGLYGGNLFDKNNAEYINAAVSAANTFNASEGRLYYIEVTPNTTYTFKKELGKFNRVCVCEEKPRVNGKLTTKNSDTSQNVCQITTSENDHYLAFYPLKLEEISTIGYDAVLETVNIYVGDTEPNIDSYANPQSLTLQTPNGLHGIPLGQTIPDAIKNSPIHMSGVYWDSVEQRYYIGNTKNENGKDVQRIMEYGVDDFPGVGVSKDSKWYDSEKSYSYELKNMSTNSPLDYVETALEKSTHFVGYNFQNFYNKGVESGFLRGQSYIVVNISKSLGICKTVDEFKQYCIDNNVKFYKILKTPIVTDTSEEELAQVNALRMNYPNNTVVNDAGAYTEVEYVADTKCYTDNKIDKKFNELAVALVSQ